MYSGTTFRRTSGNVVGVHQKIDRVARRHLQPHLMKGVDFPSIRQILHFEGDNGPDGIKRKSPSKDEPWHFIDPTKPDDRQLVELINDHVINLANALRDKNNERAAFEAAWMAHAVVDGLTPAHHYPLGDKIEELWGKPHDERISVKDKNIIRGHNKRDTLAKNWEYWGSGGIFTAHLLFELGVASTIAPHAFAGAALSQQDLDNLCKDGFETVFLQAIHRVAALKLYEAFVVRGWTRSLAATARKQLIPVIIQTVALGWYQSVLQSQELR